MSKCVFSGKSIITVPRQICEVTMYLDSHVLIGVE